MIKQHPLDRNENKDFPFLKKTGRVGRWSEKPGLFEENYSNEHFKL